MSGESVEVFATAEDRSAPTRSQDGLGFATTADVFANLWAPHLTVVSTRAAYFALLCAGLDLADASDERTAQASVLRLERMWALGAALSEDGAKEVLGRRYAEAAATSVKDRKRRQAPVDFRFFKGSTQASQGMWGAYIRPAERLELHREGRCTERGKLAGAHVREVLEDLELERVVSGRRKTAPVDHLIELAERTGFREVARTSAIAIGEGIRSEPLQRLAAQYLRGVPGGDDRHLVRGLRTWAVGGTKPFAKSARAGLALLELAAPAGHVLDAAWHAARSGIATRKLLAVPLVKESVDDLVDSANEVLDSFQKAEVHTDLVEFAGLLAKAKTRRDRFDCIVGRHVSVQRRKDQDPWMVIAGESINESGSRNPLRYNPLDSVGDNAPSLRLRALQRLATDLGKGQL